MKRKFKWPIEILIARKLRHILTVWVKEEEKRLKVNREVRHKKMYEK
jgi:hypothetical protein